MTIELKLKKGLKDLTKFFSEYRFEGEPLKAGEVQIILTQYQCMVARLCGLSDPDFDYDDFESKFIAFMKYYFEERTP